MMIGWGNFWKYLRKLDKGVGRYSNIKSYWRKGLTFTDLDNQNYAKPSPSLYVKKVYHH